MAQPPVINGFIFGTQTVEPGQTIDPFSTVTISDPVMDATDSASILLITAQGGLIRTISDNNGTLAGPGLTGGDGSYSFSDRPRDSVIGAEAAVFQFGAAAQRCVVGHHNPNVCVKHLLRLCCDCASTERAVRSST
jgi:hypothetical protein